jgi:hypothetical protein
LQRKPVGSIGELESTTQTEIPAKARQFIWNSAKEMPERVTQKRLDEFLDALKQAGGSSGNGKLRKGLDWDEEFYWKVQGQLIENGQIVPGEGRAVPFASRRRRRKAFLFRTKTSGKLISMYRSKHPSRRSG